MSSTTPSAGSVMIVAAPSGAGKSSLVNALLLQESGIVLSVSFTTRAPRPGEQDGREYFFVSEAEFREREARAEFLESAQVHGNFYGTSKRLIEDHTRAGRDVLLEIDWQGAQQVRRQFPDAVGIFILPPSVAALEQRLKQRAQDSDEVIARRVQNAAGEIAHADEFDYVIINANFDVALTQLVNVVRASRCRFGQQAARFSDLFAGFGIQT
ncbi:MAG: guanylate kinase [Oxalobacteraceae bacterium]|nr:guanylate kinase [Oxalobacteraceae bacterium]